MHGVCKYRPKFHSYSSANKPIIDEKVRNPNLAIHGIIAHNTAVKWITSKSYVNGNIKLLCYPTGSTESPEMGNTANIDV
eukprot:15343755-Ditylum_brightwellii.AAC.1